MKLTRRELTRLAALGTGRADCPAFYLELEPQKRTVSRCGPRK
jgi:hypothetical protein